LEILGAGDFDFFDIRLHAIPGTLSTEERELLRTPLGLAAEGRIPQTLTDTANRRGGDADPMHAVEPDGVRTAPKW
jgi:hypothetical protein